MMTKREILHKFLAGAISNRRFRKWLLKIDNEDGFFSDEDFTRLKTLAVVFSSPAKIKNILRGYADISIVEKLILSRKFGNLAEQDEDILIRLRELGNLGKQQKDKQITDFVNSCEGIFQNLPRLAEKKNWNEAIFAEKRSIIDKHQKEITDAIARFGRRYYFEYKEPIIKVRLPAWLTKLFEGNKP